MECSNDEARRAMEHVVNKLKTKDFEEARESCLKAQQLYPRLEEISQLLMVCNVHCSAQTKLNGGQDMDFYEILQVERFSDEDTVKKQYKKLALLLHPDKNRFPGAEAAFKLIGEANGVLTDPAKQSLYDIKCKAAMTPATPNHAFHQSTQSFHALKLQGNLSEDSLVPCLQHKPPKKASKRKPEVESSGGSATKMNDDVSRRKKTKESNPMPKPDSLKPEEDNLKTGNAGKNGFNANTRADGKERLTIVLGLRASSSMRKAGKGSTSGHGGGGIALKTAKRLNGEKKELSAEKQKRVSSEEVNGEGNKGNLKEKKQGLVNEDMNGEDMELIVKKYPYLFSSLEAIDLSKEAKDRTRVLFGLIREEKLLELEQEWRILMQAKLELSRKEKDLIAKQEGRILMQAKLELFVKEKDLIAKQLKLGLDAVKSQN